MPKPEHHQAQIPGATYRLQLNSDFDFRDSERLLPYLDALGISHLYTSPFLRARTGSPHGYDVTDHNAFNPELGGEAAFDRFTEQLAQRGMGLILDFVPNHMGIGQADNQWWLDVLEWGEASPYADYFDIDWHSATMPLRGKVLLPFLGASYGTILEEGGLRLGFDPDAGRFGVTYYEHLFPIAPRYYPELLDNVDTATVEQGTVRELRALTEGFRALKSAGRSRRRRREARYSAARFKERLAALARADLHLTEAIHRTASHYNGTPGDPRSFLPLHRLLERQTYRLAWWRVAADEINYRRFFDINDLAAIRTERAEVFQAIHQLILRLLAEGRLQGLRIDHIDGLYDPLEYCRRLRETGSQPPYLLVEKILASHETLRRDWPVQGTTGYEMLNRINGLFVNPAARQPLMRFYRRFTGHSHNFDQCLVSAKRRVIDHLLASELQVLANLFSRLAESNWRTRDFTLASLRAALAEITIYLPVYRTYVTAAGAGAADRRDLDWALGRARRADPLMDRDLLTFIHDVLTTDLARPGSGFNRNQVVNLAMKFQQFTGPAMAKSLEDTAFYRFVPLVSLNEVGGDPRQFGVTVSEFHQFTARRAEQWPDAMVTTATHDSKRGEDVRARLNVLTEMPAAWIDRTRYWARINRSKRTLVGEENAPSRNDEYLLYQTLVGSWPTEWTGPGSPSAKALDQYGQRVQSYMVKAIREAKLRSSWSHPDEPYEAAVTEFVGRLLRGSVTPFLDDLAAFVSRVAPSGAINSLAQTVLKLTLPGVPDLYQGSELWDLNLVDPDNRRPVDFVARADILRTLKEGADRDATALSHDLCQHWRDGRVKFFVIWRLLDLRRRCPELFRSGSYEPLAANGDHDDALCAFARRLGDHNLVVAVPCRKPELEGTCPGIAGLPWPGATIQLPADFRDRGFRDIFTGETLDLVPGRDTLDLAPLFSRLPVAVLESDPT